jgi:hypothetical protein
VTRLTLFPFTWNAPKNKFVVRECKAIGTEIYGRIVKKTERNLRMDGEILSRMYDCSS